MFGLKEFSAQVKKDLECGEEVVRTDGIFRQPSVISAPARDITDILSCLLLQELGVWRL